MARNKKIEKLVIDFYKTLPKELRRFAFSVKKATLTIENCIILSYQEFAEKHNVTLNEVIAYCESYSGCTYKNPHSDNYIIMYNDAADILEERKTFTIAHELGHILLGHLLALEECGIYFSSHIHADLEQEANYFAACLLCPMPVLDEIKPKSHWLIKKMFGLSPQAARIALENYNRYDKYDDISWHDEITQLFGLATYGDCDCEFGIDAFDILSPIVSVPPVIPDDVWAKKSTRTPRKAEITMLPELRPEIFDRLEHDWLYPERLGLS